MVAHTALADLNEAERSTPTAADPIHGLAFPDYVGILR